MHHFFTLTRQNWGLCSLTLIGLCLLSLSAKATHIRAGEILYRHLNGNTYEIILRCYADRESQVLIGGSGTLNFGDGTSHVINNDGNKMLRTAITSDTWMYELMIAHTFPAAGTYSLSFREFYRNENIMNMDNSVNMPFYLESTLIIDPFIGSNNSPHLKRPPIDKTMVGATYHHQPGATDPDGDSLAYRLVPNRQDNIVPVANYRDPHLAFPEGDTRNGTNEAGGAPYFKINSFTGDVVWDAPGQEGEYNLALVVEEWRKVNGKLYMIGSVTRDMQIVVEPAEEGLRLEFPISSTSAAPAQGEAIQWIITAIAPTPTDSVVLEVWGDFTERSGAAPSSSQVKAKGQASITINWTGEADLGQHYQLIAKSFNPQTPQLSRNRSAYIYQSLSAPLGLGENSYSPVHAYPNPLQGNVFYIDLPEALGIKVAIEMYDTKGKMVLQEKSVVTSKQHPIFLNKTAPGLYILHLYHSGRFYRSQLVVQ